MQSFNKENTTVIKFRKKDGDKDRNSDETILKKMEARELEENIDVDRRKKISLAGRLKSQFHLIESIRIKGLKTPDNLDSYKEEKYKRDQSETTKLMSNLEHELSN